MSLDTLLGPLLLVGFFVAFFAFAIPAVYALNIGVIGPSYDRKAAQIFERTGLTEKVLFEEQDVAMILRSRAALAIGMQFKRANVRITDRALYVAQQSKFLGRRMGQPVLAIALTPMGLDPLTAQLAFVMYVAGQPTVEGRALSLPLTSRGQTHTLTLEPKGSEHAAQILENLLYPR